MMDALEEHHSGTKLCKVGMYFVVALILFYCLKVQMNYVCVDVELPKGEFPKNTVDKFDGKFVFIAYSQLNFCVQK